MKRSKTLLGPIVVVAILSLAPSSAFAHRHYDPEHGRWLQRDPLEVTSYALLTSPPPFRSSFFSQRAYQDGMNLYQYVKSNPATGTDPSGLITVDPDCPQWVAKQAADMCDNLLRKLLEEAIERLNTPSECQCSESRRGLRRAILALKSTIKQCDDLVIHCSIGDEDPDPECKGADGYRNPNRGGCDITMCQDIQPSADQRDLVCHEVGHCGGARHTGGGNAYEIGAWCGACGPAMLSDRTDEKRCCNKVPGDLGNGRDGNPILEYAPGPCNCRNGAKPRGGPNSS